MLYIMKQKFFSFGNFVITDDQGYEVLYIKRKWGFNKYVIENVRGEEQVTIRQKLFSLRLTFDITSNEHYYGTINKPFFSFYDNYNVKLYNNDELRIEGDFFSHEYNISSPNYGGVASVSKQWFTFNDTYGVFIHDGMDAALVLGCVLVIDIFHAHKGSRHHHFHLFD